MEFICNGQNYTSVLGSDVDRDGMYIEVSKGGEEILEIFYSDKSGEMTFTAFLPSIPIELIEFAISQARRSTTVREALESAIGEIDTLARMPSGVAL